MKAAVLKSPRVLQVEEVPRPTLEQDEVLIKVKACAICGSDIRYFLGENPWALHTLGVDKPNPPNIILGHEFAGELIDVGSNAAMSKWIGKRVVVSPYKSCGICRFCRIGKYHLCRETIHLGHGAGWPERQYYPGGMAEFCQVWADKIYLLPDSISYEEATLLDIAGVGIHALGISGISTGSNVAIIGVGPLGACLVQTAKMCGAVRIFCSDVRQRPLELASETGADVTINVAKENLVARVMKETNDFGVDVVIDTVGLPETQLQALRILAPAGTLVNMVTNTNEVSFKLSEISGERTIRSSSNYFFHDFQKALDLAAMGKLRLRSLITHRFPLGQVDQAFDLMIDKGKHGAMKVVLLP